MKRSEALRPLSREHQHALAVGRALRLAEDLEPATSEFLEFWAAEGAEHFRIEEEVLLPTWELLGTVAADAAARLSREHLEIRAAALALTGASSLAEVHRLGEKLVAHVRFEERELFPLIEADLTAADQDRLAAVLVAAEVANGQE